jgi:hypothetical protein
VIRVVSKPEFPAFGARVRVPGAAFLATCPSPTSEQFRKNNFWSRAARELHAAYAGVCAYTAMFLPEQGTVDHFLPKALHPQLAYEWSNFRLAGGRVNNCKGNLVGIVDPFDVEDDWFYMDIPACLLRPNPVLAQLLRSRIAQTINSLRLNDDDSYAQERCNILMEYARGDVSLGFLERRYPFLAKEVKRQNLDQPTLLSIFKIQPAAQ